MDWDPIECYVSQRPPPAVKQEGGFFGLKWQLGGAQTSTKFDDW